MINLGKESRDLLIKGINQLANAVKVTLGPKGKNVVLFNQDGKAYVTKDGISGVAQDFINYILSADGQQVVSDNGYIAVADNAEAFTSDNSEGKIVVARVRKKLRWLDLKSPPIPGRLLDRNDRAV